MKKERKRMKMKFRKLTSIIIAGVMGAAIMAGCGGQDASTGEGTPSAAGTETTASGTVSMNGSTSMKKLVEASCEAFNAKYPSIKAEGQFTGSGSGLEAVANGSADIGNSSRALSEEEKANGLVENIVAIDGIAVVVDNANTVASLTKQQLADIYTGKITNWSEVGGSDGSIVVIGREAGSGTRGAFEEILEIEDKCVYAQELDQTGAVLTTVSSTPNSIGYVSLDVLNDTVKAVSIDGVEPTVENIKAGTYSLQRPFVMATKGEISAQNEAVQTWFEFMNSEEGQAIVESVGLITVE